MYRCEIQSRLLMSLMWKQYCEKFIRNAVGQLLRTTAEKTRDLPDDLSLMRQLRAAHYAVSPPSVVPRVSRGLSTRRKPRMCSQTPSAQTLCSTLRNFITHRFLSRIHLGNVWWHAVFFIRWAILPVLTFKFLLPASIPRETEIWLHSQS